jgi:hypothetical protein
MTCRGEVFLASFHTSVEFVKYKWQVDEKQSRKVEARRIAKLEVFRRLLAARLSLISQMG